MKGNLTRIKEIADSAAKRLDMEIVSVEFVKEMGLKIIRVIAKKADVFTIDDTSILSSILSEELEKEDLFPDDYYLEVSSEGIEKELTTEFDINDSVGKYVCVRLYAKYKGKKEIFGNLLEVNDQEIRLKSDTKGLEEELTLPKDKIAKIRLAVKF